MNNRVNPSGITRQRFALRKLSVGVVSVLIGLTFISGNTKSAKADTSSQSAGAPVTEDNASSPQVAATTALQTNQSVSLNTSQSTVPLQTQAQSTAAATPAVTVNHSDQQVPTGKTANRMNNSARVQAAVNSTVQPRANATAPASTASQYNTNSP